MRRERVSEGSKITPGVSAGESPEGARARLALLEARALAAEAALDLLGVALFALDAGGRVLRANRAAERLLEQDDGLRLRDRRLGCARAAEQTRLEAAIGHAAAMGAGARRGIHALAVSRRSLRRSLGLIVAPLFPTGRRAGHGAGGAALLVRVSDPEDVRPPRPEHLTALFALTPTEARLAAALATRRSLQEHAAAAGISLGTVRGTLKRVLAKTGCRSQRELVHLLLRSPAALLHEGSP